MVDVGRLNVVCIISTYVEWKWWVLRTRVAGKNQERARTYLPVKLLSRGLNLWKLVVITHFKQFQFTDSCVQVIFGPFHGTKAFYPTYWIQFRWSSMSNKVCSLLVHLDVGMGCTIETWLKYWKSSNDFTCLARQARSPTAAIADSLTRQGRGRQGHRQGHRDIIHTSGIKLWCLMRFCGYFTSIPLSLCGNETNFTM